MKKSQQQNTINDFRIFSVQDVYTKLENYSDVDKSQVVEVINGYMRSNKIKSPIIRIHSPRIANLVQTNQLSNNLAIHHADIFIIDYSLEDLSNDMFLRNIMDIVMPRLTEKGLLVAKQESGIKVWRKNVRYSLNTHLYEINF